MALTPTFPTLQSALAFSTPAFSTHVITPVPHFPLPHFQSPPQCRLYGVTMVITMGLSCLVFVIWPGHGQRTTDGSMMATIAYVALKAGQQNDSNANVKEEAYLNKLCTALALRRRLSEYDPGSNTDLYEESLLTVVVDSIPAMCYITNIELIRMNIWRKPKLLLCRIENSYLPHPSDSQWRTVTVFDDWSPLQQWKQEAQLSQKGRAMPRVVEYFR